MHKITWAIIASIILAGCSAPPSQLRPVRFFHKTATDGQFVNDRDECLKMAEWIKLKGSLRGYTTDSKIFNKTISARHVTPSCNTFYYCLVNKGYIETPNGNLEVTRDSMIICSPE